MKFGLKHGLLLGEVALIGFLLYRRNQTCKAVAAASTASPNGAGGGSVPGPLGSMLTGGGGGGGGVAPSASDPTGGGGTSPAPSGGGPGGSGSGSGVIVVNPPPPPPPPPPTGGGPQGVLTGSGGVTCPPGQVYACGKCMFPGLASMLRCKPTPDPMTRDANLGIRSSISFLSFLK